jgi:hypothetical protein
MISPEPPAGPARIAATFGGTAPGIDVAFVVVAVGDGDEVMVEVDDVVTTATVEAVAAVVDDDGEGESPQAPSATSRTHPMRSLIVIDDPGRRAPAAVCLRPVVPT